MNATAQITCEWALKDTPTHTAELMDSYVEDGYDVVLIAWRYNDGHVEYWVGNVGLGGLKCYQAFNTADKYFYELIGRIHRNAENRRSGQ